MSEPTQPPQPPPTFLDFAFHGAENAIDGLISGIPELRSVAVVFDWGVPVGADVPPGVVFTRGPDGGLEDVRHPLALFGLLQQHGRVGLFLATRFQQLLLAANETAEKMAKLINERQRQLDDLNARIAVTRGSTAAAALAADAAPGAGPGPAAGGPPGDEPPGGP